MKNPKDVKSLLQETPFFHGMDDHYVDLISDCGVLVHFNAGEFLLKEGEEAESFYLIDKGNVSIESDIPGDVLTIAKYGALDVVGYSWLFPPYRNAFDARAITEVDAIKLNGQCLRAKANKDHELGYQFLNRFATTLLYHMQGARRQMLNIYGNTGKVA